MGHSMSSVDEEYMEIVENVIHPIEWRISQYENSPSAFNIVGYSFAEKVKFYDSHQKNLIR